MPFIGDTHTLPAGSLAANGAFSDADTQHNAPLNDISASLTLVKGQASSLLGGAVRHDVAQTLTNAQKQQAQVNIGISSSSVSDFSGTLLSGSAIVATAVSDVTMELTIPVNHGLVTGMPVYVSVTSGSAIADTIYWVIRAPMTHDKIKLAISYVNAMTGTSISLIAGTLPSLKVHRDPMQKIVVVGSLKKDGSQGGTIIGPFTGEVTFETFGADAAASDNSLQMQMAFHWVRTSYETSSGKWLASLNGQNVPYRHTRPLQICSIAQPDCTFDNVSLYSACAGVPALDWCGSNRVNMRNLHIEGDQVSSPSVGMLGKRRLTALVGGGVSATMLPAGSHNITGQYISGHFTLSPFIVVNTDLLSLSDATYENRYNSPVARAGFASTSSQAEVRHFGIVTPSLFVPTPDASYSAADIGTITKLVFRNCHFRRPAPYQIEPTAINAAATPIIFTFASGDLAGAGIVGDTQVTFGIGNNTFTLKRGFYTFKNVTATTAELWSEDGATQVSHLTGNHSGGPVSGAYTTLTGRITPRMAAPLTICGPLAECENDGYILGYGESSIQFDVTEGDIKSPRFRNHAESADLHTFLLTNIGGTPRSMSAARLEVSGDLAGYAHVYKPFGQGEITIDGELIVSDKQSTQTIVTNWGLRMFGGDVAGLRFYGYVRTTLTGLMANVASIGVFDATVFDAEAQATTKYPVGTYKTDAAKNILLSADAGQLGTAAGVADRFDLEPFVMPRNMTIDQFGVSVSTAVGGAQGKLVIYAPDINGRPDRRLFESTVLDFSTVGFKSFAVSQTLIRGGLYWLGVRHSSTATIRMLPDNSSLTLSSAATPSGNPNKMLQRSLAFATAAPANWGWTATEEVVGPVPAFWVSEA